MKKAEKKPGLSALLAGLQEDAVLKEVDRRLKEGEDPLSLVEECQKGVRLAGEQYEQGIYFISGLIMAGEIMHEVGDMVLPLLKRQVSGSDSGRILLGTVEGDIHYIGKDIMKVLLHCHGFTVFDMGEDVPPTEFLVKAREIRPHIVGLSCLLQSCYEAMRATIGLVRAEMGQRGPSFIIGGQVDEQIRRYTGADGWATNAMKGVRLCQQLVR